MFTILPMFFEHVLIAITCVYFQLFVQTFFVCYLDLLEVICMLFLSLKSLFQNFAYNVQKMIKLQFSLKLVENSWFSVVVSVLWF